MLTFMNKLKQPPNILRSAKPRNSLVNSPSKAILKEKMCIKFNLLCSYK